MIILNLKMCEPFKFVTINCPNGSHKVTGDKEKIDWDRPEFRSLNKFLFL